MRLFKDYSKDFNNLKQEMKLLKREISDENDKTLIKLNMLENLIEDIQKQQDALVSQLIEINQILSNQTPNGMVEEGVPKPKKEYYYGNLKISTSYQKEMNYTELTDDFLLSHTVRGREYISSFTLTDVILLAKLESEHSWNSWGDLQELTKLPPQIIRKIIYNLKNNYFKQFLSDYNLIFSKEYGLLYVNNKPTNLPIKNAKYIVECVNNSSNPATTILKLEKIGDCPRELCRLIGINSKNNTLLSLFEENPIELENNPQKRKEKGL